MKARIPQHREFIINFPDTVEQAKAAILDALRKKGGR